MPVKHFNMGNAFGVVTKAEPSKKKEGKEDTGAFTVEVQMRCRSEVYGNVTVFARVFNERAKAFLDFHKKHPDALIKLNGYFSQYRSEKGTLYNQLRFFDWEEREGQVPRCGFVLTGELTRILDSADGKEKEFYLHLERPRGKEGDEVNEEDFILFLHPKDAKKIKDAEPPQGATVTLEGYLCQMGDYNMIADQREGDVKAYIKTVKIHG